MRGLSAGSVLRSVTSPRLSGRHWREVEGEARVLGEPRGGDRLRGVQAEIDELVLHLGLLRPRQHAREQARFRGADRHVPAPAERPFGAHPRHLHRVRHGLVQRVGGLGAEGEAHHEVVLEVAPDLRRLRHHRQAEALQRRAVADAGEHEQLRALDGAGREDHLAPGAVDLLRPIGPAHGDAHGALAFEHNAQAQPLRFDAQVRPLQRGAEIGHGRAPAPPLVDVELVRRHALVPLAVEVPAAREAERHAGLDEGAAARRRSRAPRRPAPGRPCRGTRRHRRRRRSPACGRRAGSPRSSSRGRRIAPSGRSRGASRAGTPGR